MKLSWFVVVKINILASQPTRQFWNAEMGKWEDIPIIRVPKDLESFYLTQENAG